MITFLFSRITYSADGPKKYKKLGIFGYFCLFVSRLFIGQFFFGPDLSPRGQVDSALACRARGRGFGSGVCLVFFALKISCLYSFFKLVVEGLALKRFGDILTGFDKF